ncbi:mannose-6-phosphate isomerase [Bifidobacterium pseudolongum subsp. pseudolongum]|uniref:mannose-6-phosphate isomerase n=1 Tax=Bifidobacterium pseudolongum subsp. pseudolongum TaxID=31954 RepID=A0A4Q5AC69_9BIFI|nr:mannose-6-phosphate isomerase, class I [Bifidobacterium pseudolongum]RYQ21996.1 mannose-6-phosphate isomerase [Bifidobacterium pseudolongum subsp. pseudolongum]
MFTIRPVPKRYAWGSGERLQSMFHLTGEQWRSPLAEMWFSGHPQSPSLIEQPGGAPVALTDAIAARPEYMVGARGSSEFGPVLPFLFKVISARVPLSLQVHPVDFQARAGFNMENREAIALDAPERSFRDMNAKSEMVVALEPFHASVGFAPKSFALHNLTLLESPVAQTMVRAFSRSAGDGEFAQADARMPIAASVWPESRRRMFRAFHAAITAAPLNAQELERDLLQARARCTAERNRMAFDHAVRATRAFPGDPSVLALLMMNPVRLEEGESVFLPTGCPHAYIYGTGAEIMTNSDNVLRAGMTVKHKDIDNLLQCLDCRISSPIDPSDTRLGTLLMRDVVFYKPPVNEFMLCYGRVDAAHEPWPVMNRLAVRYDALVQQMGGKVVVPHLGPRVVLCTQGAVRCVTDHDDRVLRQGEAAFVPAADGWARIDPVVTGEAAPQGQYVMASTPF